MAGRGAIPARPYIQFGHGRERTPCLRIVRVLIFYIQTVKRLVWRYPVVCCRVGRIRRNLTAWLCAAGGIYATGLEGQYSHWTNILLHLQCCPRHPRGQDFAPRARFAPSPTPQQAREIFEIG